MFDSFTSTTDESPLPPPPVPLAFGNVTHRGRVRLTNEDDSAAAPDLGFFVVADGVGGLPGGALAPRLATIGMVYALRASGSNREPLEEGDADSPPPESFSARLVAAGHQAHQLIRDHAARSGFAGAATTMAALWIVGERALVANTGDSRVYRLAGESLEQLTKDHTAIQEIIDVFGPQSAKSAAHLSNIVTAVLGGRQGRTPTVRVVDIPFSKPEVLLLCTDGLFKMLSEPEIASVLSREASPQRAAQILVDRANEAGGEDNITVIVVHASPKPDALS